MKKRINYWKNKRVLITGGAGFLGKHLVSKLLPLHPKEIIIPRSREYDLRMLDNCRKIVKNMDVVIHLAANVGGIGYNMQYPGTLFYDNILMGVHMIEESRKAGVSKFVAIGTICAYPKFTPIPFREKDLWNGYPEETNAAYGLAKKMLIVQVQAYRKQYGFNGIYLLPVNMYGPGDTFDVQRSHVIPALIKKVETARIQGARSVEIWGTGKATREFLYVADAAEAIIRATEKYNDSEPINIGTGSEISIKDLAKKIKKMVGYTGKLTFNKAKPDGQPRRVVDVSRARKEFGFEAKTQLDQGLQDTIAWFRKFHHPKKINKKIK